MKTPPEYVVKTASGAIITVTTHRPGKPAQIVIATSFATAHTDLTRDELEALQKVFNAELHPHTSNPPTPIVEPPVRKPPAR